MGFLDKMKQAAGIGGVKIDLQVDPNISQTKKEVIGQVLLTTKSDQHVSRVTVTLTEELTTPGRQPNQYETKRFDLGQQVVAKDLDLKAGETRTIEFKLPFTPVMTGKDYLKSKGGVLGTIGKVGSLMSGERRTHKLVATANVKGTAIGPSETKNVVLVE